MTRAPETQPAPPTTDRLEGVDMLRGVAVALVVWCHLHDRFLFEGLHRPIRFWGNTWYGVELFFVISGFVVSRAFLPKLERARQAGLGEMFRTTKNFFIQRGFRLLPVAWLIIPLSLAADAAWRSGADREGAFAGLEVVSIFTYWHNYFVMHANGVDKLGWYWSLSIEEQFYIVLPFTLMLFENRRKQILFFGAMIGLVTFVLRPWSEFHGAPLWPELRLSSPLKFDSLFLGVALYIFTTTDWYQSSTHIRWLRSRRVLPLGLLMSFALMIIPRVLPEASWSLKFPLMNLVSTFAIACAAEESGVYFRATPLNSLLIWLGRRSYTIYLVHIPIMMLVNAFARNLGYDNVAFLIVTALGFVVIFTAFFYHYVETPLTNYGRRIAAKNRRV